MAHGGVENGMLWSASETESCKRSYARYAGWTTSAIHFQMWIQYSRSCAKKKKKKIELSKQTNEQTKRIPAQSETKQNMKKKLHSNCGWMNGLAVE